MLTNENLASLIEQLESAGSPFVAIAGAPWISRLELRLGDRLPRDIRLLYTSYLFPEFDLGGVTLFANLDSEDPEDITQAMFADTYMSAWLIERGFVQFGRSDTGWYDPVCLDLNASATDPTVVRFDHEDILIARKKVRCQILAASFSALVRSATRDWLDVD